MPRLDALRYREQRVLGIRFGKRATSLDQRGVIVVPDFIANAGGVICAAVEYHDGSETDALEQIAENIRRNTREVLTRSRDERITPRRSAVELARERVQAAMALRT